MHQRTCRISAYIRLSSEAAGDHLIYTCIHQLPHLGYLTACPTSLPTSLPTSAYEGRGPKAPLEPAAGHLAQVS